ncbi:16S rRNA (guanine(527)-N(7))-methyltransferase RsmG [Conexibacter sp. W3-3-2]|uniref:16S rRNA (guanine(527)-N(7))-methyltransferase RsmG n=1 Tax=Conexibacter sp. W3-3-2 TaxID=2675227 RepID=UPI0012B8AFFD|nr:16S rRNA (guanine(527)-N(7))-methyltransferase RsmG [Conexibacter sp. W3-3-2]MTD45547.1 16S rRNA (guanine(527)-N(7))-methyltransferase RsmG [Conexibacter sp. W3-3-2]
MTVALPRLEELVLVHDLPIAAAARLDLLLERFATDPQAPTTVTAPREGADVHVADSLVALEVPVVREARRIADLGAGAGVPGLVLALALPEATVGLVESVGKKCDFMARTAEAMGLTNAAPVARRAEDWPDGIGVHDLVTARALAPLTALVEYAAPLLQEGGHLCAWKGQRDPAEEADGAAAAEATGMALVEVRAVRPWPGVEARHLHVFCKISPTPPRFPRRPGMARKRPIVATS